MKTIRIGPKGTTAQLPLRRDALSCTKVTGREVAAVSIALRQCGRRMDEEVLDLLPEEAGARLVAFNMAIASCAKVSHWNVAAYLLHSMHQKACQPDAISFTAARSACKSASQWRVALSLMRDAECRGLAMDAFAYSAVMSACEKGRLWSQALRLLYTMHRNQLQPEAVTITAALGACASSAKWEKALGTKMFDDFFMDELATDVMQHPDVGMNLIEFLTK
eukprot:Skav215171  [mRNA]  locus=scaffold4227:117548:122119:+ [translate_table: standard]